MRRTIKELITFIWVVSFGLGLLYGVYYALDKEHLLGERISRNILELRLNTLKGEPR